MRIGVPKEVLNNENRVAMTPAGVFTLKESGHEVFIQQGAGLGSSITDEEYTVAGAIIVETAEEAWNADMVMKVKEPQSSEYDFFREGQIIFTYFHLATEVKLTNVLLEKKVTAIAYETVQLSNNTLPLLAPMSEVAGRMAILIGAQFLQKTNGGQGTLLGGIPGVSRGNVTVIGGGMAGTNAVRVAIGMGAHVTVIDLSTDRLRQLEELFGNDVQTLVSNPFNIADAVKDADLVVGAVLIPGARAPKLVSEEMVKTMKPGSVLVDIAIDQGGIFETSDRITTHDEPTYEKHGVVHYAVANMPGAVPRTATMGLTNNTVPYALQIANKGVDKALLDNPALQKGLNTFNGHITYKAVADAQDAKYVPAESLLQQ
ncbi:alanine dehydrogenase [Sporosarcina sp. G11-34]|uniref:alanine dehydrogenase n=1 Tax=Sporosarcina sp. G11-34 TaxID=2849605 RepID=UPI0022A926C2|nr:alanine dehydrogenase [Sporosarcina sp. G11-34]MCZ2257979.1 alanine dehydrogenase [Sporosarcina sp. G11-34]